MICLGIESTAHTFGIGIIDDSGKKYANERVLFSTKEGGLIPSKVADHHVEKFRDIINSALEKANLTLADINLISYSQSPGIGNCLRIGAAVARSLALLYNIPLIGVNHCIAHLEIGKLMSKAKDPVFLYASGANTQVIAYEGGKYRVFGETLDNGVGNFLDGFARYIGLGFPGGPKIYELSLKHKEKFEKLNKPVELIELPYVVKGMDVSFGGLSTNLKQKFDSKKDSFSKEALAFSLQETAFAMLVEVSERAMAHCNKSELLLGGGVACNIRLKEMCKIMAKERGAESYDLPIEVNIDNGLMIAWLGVLMHKAGGETKVEDADIKPYLRTDDVDVYW
ncbi:tRNA (adenosine(37)-N6)-threonylcarbamoyltransferase complex transferase subunit TsaD [Candidatus Woesearchaeota archaeon]|jgi:glycoprotease/Kae1 family metallohydrolase|nr:tRNA (adenosine(37)-N6)-threonylcarbamoyltransferase complex transferase subunit TsaD [Candidatus Woesearchaeota archaeon]MBT6520101.1 tRNA (adenosine(37)-N6)-threonylcarbamoyltransferase complex transferase subunit TsaD [Candidatus Woesearchaeota archaeon]MBT7366706.1 tRNA (adenosine(37)-N6)-threonylcarbamoyltransferase complex transferase subunit TsaD [Candidatus Woesearchaeota archaeon]